MSSLWHSLSHNVFHLTLGLSEVVGTIWVRRSVTMKNYSLRKNLSYMVMAIHEMRKTPLFDIYYVHN